MHFFKYAGIHALLLIPLTCFASSSTWTDMAVNDNWTDPGNWTTGVPDSTSDNALFPTIGVAQTVVVDQGVSVNQISFDSADNYSINGPGQLTFGGLTMITVDNTGTHTINAPVPNLANIVNNTANPLTITGNISGPNTLFIRNGLIILSGSNTYNGGGTEIFSLSTLQLNANNSISNNHPLVANGTLVLNSGIGTVGITGLSGTGTIDLNNNILSMFSGSFSGTIMETAGPGGINKTTAGNLTLSGASTYTGLTTIQQGTLSVTGSITSPVQVNGGAFLTGTGSVGATTNSGTVSPGTSIGTLTINGNYTQTGDLLIEISDDGSSDLLNVTGIATLGGTLTLQPEPGIYPQGSTFTFMNYASRVGTLTLVEDSSLEFSISYFGTFAQLVNAVHGAVLPIPKRLLHGNPRRVADYLFCRNFLPSNPDLLNVMAALVSVPADKFAEDLVKLSPVQFGALPLTNLQNHRIMGDVIVENTEKFYWCDPCDAQDKTQEGCEANRKVTSVWVAPVGYYYDQSGVQSQIGFDSYALGLGIGASHLFWRAFHVGGGAGYTYSKINWDKDRGDGHINSVYLGPSLGWGDKNAFLNLLLLGSYNDYTIDRKISFPGINRTASNGHHSYDVLARLDGGYNFRVHAGGKLDHVFIIPEARLSYLNIFEERYTESGADSIDLTVDSKYSAFLQTDLLVKFLRDFHTRTLCITPAFQVGWVSTISLSSGNYKSRFYKQETCQPYFVVKSYHLKRNQLSLGLDLNIRTLSDWIVDLGYEVDFLDNSYVMDGKIKVEKRF